MVYIAVVGPGHEATPQNRRDAYEVGRLLAERGAVVVTGGLGGVMEAAAQGCADAQGTSVGLLPGHRREAGNPHLSVALPTGLGELRNGLLVCSADGVVSIGGSWGTLSELALAKGSELSVVSVDGWSVLDANGQRLPLDTAATPGEAVDWILAAVAARTGARSAGR